MKDAINLTEAREYLIGIMRQAGEMLRKYFVSGDFTLRQKEGVDFTTQADEEVDTFLNNKAIRVSETDNLREVVVAVDWAYDLEKRKDVVKWLGNIIAHVRQIKSMGSGVSDLASLSAGRIDAYMHSKLKPWDVAASALLIEKAGGKITTTNGGSWNVFNPDLLATNGIIHWRILDIVNKV